MPEPATANPAPAAGKVLAVVVTYRPDPGLVQDQLKRLAGQVAEVLIVDNSPPEAALALPVPEGVRIHRPGQNLGVAGAVNLGLQRAREAGLAYLLSLDQDSLPDPAMVACLVEAMESLAKQGRRPAAVGPAIVERASGARAPFVRFRLPLNRRLHGDAGTVACDFLITSGMLMDVAAAAEIGGMDEALFIDNVDLEWCFRAARAGYGVFGVHHAGLEHAIGEPRGLFGRLGPRYRHHGPDRLYYMMRNRLWLYRGRAPWAWRVHDLVRLAGKFALFALVRPRRVNLAAMGRGLADGLRGPGVANDRVKR